MITLTFMFIGGGGLIGSIIWRGKQASASMPTPQAPWQQRADWAAGRIVSSNKKNLIFSWVFAGLWNLISLPTLFFLPTEVFKKGNPIAAIGFIFPVIGAGLLIWAIQTTRRWLRFGESVFEMAATPGALGGALEGTIRLSRFLQAENGVTLRLACLNRRTSGSGDDRSTSEAILWQHEETLPPGDGMAIPVAFLIPTDCSETTTIDSSDGVLWRLHATASVPGVDYATQFEVPVFAVPLTPAQRAEAEMLRAKDRAELAAYQLPTTSRIRVHPSLREDGTEFYFPACRNLGMAVTLTVMLLVWAGATAVVVTLKVPHFVAFLLGGVNLVFVYAALRAWTRTARLVVNPEQITLETTLLGVPRRRAIPAGDVSAIKTKVGLTTSTTVFSDIKLVCTNGKEITAASSIKDSREAEWLAAEMAKCMRLNVNS